MNRNYLFDFLVKKYDVDEIIFLGKKVSIELIEEAFQTENYDLVKAACMSLDADWILFIYYHQRFCLNLIIAYQYIKL